MNDTQRKQANDDRALYEFLEEKYGPAIAQGLIDQINKADDTNYIADYMDVKMISEALEGMTPDWIGYYSILKSSYDILYKRAMDAFDVPSFTPTKRKEAERMAA